MDEIIKLLIWDDNDAEAARIKGCVETYKTVHNWPLTIEAKSDEFKDFLQYLRKNHKNFDLLIMDCLEGGHEVITQALDTLNVLKSDINVVAITIDSMKMGHQFTDLYTRYSKCRSVYKSLFYSPTKPDSCENVLSDMLGLHKTKYGITTNITLSIEPDLYLEYIIQSLGGVHVLSQLILELKDELNLDVVTNDFKIESLSQGLSGAIVLKLTIKDEAGNNSNWFLKISRDRDSLVRELDNVTTKFDSIPAKYRLNYKVTKPVSINDKFFALVAELATDSSSIRKAIVTDNSGDSSLKIIKELMNDCMKLFYESKRKISGSTHIVHDIMDVFNNRRLSFLQISIKELEVFLNENDIIKDINKYKGSSEPGMTFFSKENLKKRLVHGDFHGNNILVSKNGDIVIIDPADIKTDHWSRDICLLIVDLFAHGIDADSKEYFGISNINKWKKLGLKIVQNKNIKNNGKNNGVVASINWLTNINNLNNIFGDLFELWEFQLSLGVEFLRIAYKQDQLPAGKRVACLLIGKEAFKFADKTYSN